MGRRFGTRKRLHVPSVPLRPLHDDASPSAYLPRPTRTTTPSFTDLVSSLRTFPTFILVTAATSVGDIGSLASRRAARTAARSPEYRTLLASPSTAHVQVPRSNWTAFSM